MSPVGSPDFDEDMVPDFREIAKTCERPAIPDPIVEAEHFEVEATDADAAIQPEPEPDPKPPVRARNKIWDIESDDEPGEDPGLRQRAQRAQAAAETLRQIEAQEKQRSSKSAVGTAPAASSGGRAKTRILGFHAAESEGDVFAAPKAAASAAGHFPAGWIAVVDGPGRGASFTVCPGVSTIGRDPGQSICLDFGDMNVSRENHASIAYDDEQNRFFIGHGGKSNIVRRNGNPVLATEDLADGDEIRIGKTTLRFVALCGPDFTWGTEEDRQNADVPDD